MNYTAWHKLSDPEKIDLLREELQGVKRLVQYGVAAAGVVGAGIGSLVTIVVQHFLFPGS